MIKLGKLVIPKHSADMKECMSALQVYYEYKPDWITNEAYKKRLKELIGKGQNESAYTKKSQVPAYYGFIEWESIDNAKSRRRITDYGIKFYDAYVEKNVVKQQELIIQSLETMTFGRNNYGSHTSDSDVEPPCVCFKAILDLGWITLQEFACLLTLLADCGYSYEQGIFHIRMARRKKDLKAPIGIKSDYMDPKGILILERWGLLESKGSYHGSKKYIISPNIIIKYGSRLGKLKLYNVETSELLSNVKGTLQDDVITMEDVDSLDKYVQEQISLSLEEYEITSDLKDEINNREPQAISSKYGRRYKTDYRVIEAALKEAGRICVSDEKHILFKKPNGENYVEGHHMIPMAAQKDFVVNLDRTENIASLCPLCHRALHYGEKSKKREILQIIYNNKKKKELEKVGISISLEKLIEKYY